MSPKRSQHSPRKLIVLFVVTFAIIAIITLLFLTFTHREQRALNNLASSCPKLYENDLFEFRYPCGWLLDEDGNTLVFTKFFYGDKGGRTTKMYLTIYTPSESGPHTTVGDDLSDCKGGEYFSRQKMMIPSTDGGQHEACLHGEHGGQTLTIRSDRSSTGYVSINAEYGLEQIIESLQMK